MNDNSFSPIFVVGYMHSGTTLLLDILSSHSSIFSSISETNFYEYLPIIRETFPDLNDEKTLRDFLDFTVHNILSSRQIIGRRKDAQGDDIPDEDMDFLFHRARVITEHGAIFPLVFGYFAEKAGKTFWLEKTPTHIFSIDRILSFIPTARFVEIVRDPRAVLASKKVRKASVWTERYPVDQRPFKDLEKAFNPFWDTLSWKSAIDAGTLARQNHPEKILKIRYEDLVTYQEDTILKVCEFLSLRFEPDMLDINTRNTAYYRDNDFTGISDKFVNRWQEVLITSEINIPQMLSGKEMQANRYSRISTSILSKLMSIGMLLASFLEFFIRLLKRYKIGGSRYVINVIRNYFRRLGHLLRRYRLG